MDGSGRDVAGRFAVGNPGGPGRPRRLIERDYLTALSDAVSAADWQDVVARALADAKIGDARARDWLARLLVGVHAPSLLDVAVSEARGITPDEEIVSVARQRQIDEQCNARLDK